MLASAGADDRPGFDKLCGDLLGGDTRDRLILGLTVLAGVLDR